MKKIDEQLQWYAQNSNSLYDDMVSIELEKINSLYDRYEDHTDEIFVEEIIESFCKIIERQRDKIYDLETENGVYGFHAPASNTGGSANGGFGFSGQPSGHGFMSYQKYSVQSDDVIRDGFSNDKQVQEAFTQYCLSSGKSSYTVNDYCSRIKNLWKSFYSEYKEGVLPEELIVDEEVITSVNPLLNAYNHTEELSCYISMKIAGSEGNRNWANTRAAFNKFDEFKMSLIMR